MFARIAVAVGLWLAATACQAGFLTDGRGGYLLDERGVRLLVGDGVHTVTFLSHWGPDFNPTQSISVWEDVAADKSTITFRIAAFDTTSAIVSTAISRVFSLTNIVALQTCPQFECDYTVPATSLSAGPNEFVLSFTNAANKSFGVYTRISKPQ